MTASKFIPRSFEKEDIPAVEKLAADLGLSEWSRNDYLAEMRRADSQMLVAVAGERLAGFVVGRRVPASNNETKFDAEIYNIGVERELQTQGAGRLLLTAFLEECRSQNVEEVWLEVRSNNDNAITFYERFGFRQVSRRRNFYRDPADDGITMRLTMVYD